MEIKDAYDISKKAIDERYNLIVVGECSVRYHGRAASKLSSGERIVIVKQDGSFLVHQNKNLAAINYQPPKGIVSCELSDGTLTLRAQRSKPKEILEAIFTRVFFANSFALKDDSDIKVFGTEKNLSNLLMQDLSVIEKGLRPLKNESIVPRGHIDILAEDIKGRLVVIEVKRRTADLSAVSQLKRYVHEVAKRKDKETRGILCAPSISPNALAFLEREGFEYVRLDYEVSNPSAKIRGLEKKQKGISDFL
ncbi:MAG: endonuclease NucS [archaeon]